MPGCFSLLIMIQISGNSNTLAKYEKIYQKISINLFEDFSVSTFVQHKTFPQLVTFIFPLKT